MFRNILLLFQKSLKPIAGVLMEMFGVRGLMFLYAHRWDTVVNRLRQLQSNQMLVIIGRFFITHQILTSSGILCVSKDDSQYVRLTSCCWIRERRRKHSEEVVMFPMYLYTRYLRPNPHQVCVCSHGPLWTEWSAGRNDSLFFLLFFLLVEYTFRPASLTNTNTAFPLWWVDALPFANDLKSV